MPKYLLILRGAAATGQHQSPGELQQLTARFEAWAGRLMAEGRLIDGTQLAPGEGRVLAVTGGRVQASGGPYGAPEQRIAGLHLLQADDYEHAVSLCRDHPELSTGGSVEIRRLDSMAQQ